MCAACQVPIKMGLARAGLREHQGKQTQGRAGASLSPFATPQLTAVASPSAQRAASFYLFGIPHVLPISLPHISRSLTPGNSANPSFTSRLCFHPCTHLRPPQATSGLSTKWMPSPAPGSLHLPCKTHLGFFFPSTVPFPLCSSMTLDVSPGALRSVPASLGLCQPLADAPSVLLR